MGGESGVSIKLGDWVRLGDEAYPIRYDVFVVEQAVPEALERDEFDAVSLHAVAYLADGEAVGTGRLLPDGHIGRMAVRGSARGLGVGGLLLSALIDAARERGLAQVVLNAQSHAQGFYGRYGFEARGDIFLDAGIDHIEMARSL